MNPTRYLQQLYQKEYHTLYNHVSNLFELEIPYTKEEQEIIQKQDIYGWTGRQYIFSLNSQKILEEYPELIEAIYQYPRTVAHETIISKYISIEE
jgi:hypothetical protein